MKESRSLFFRKGTLKAVMRAYGFSLGGGKGSFGFYPHLKERVEDKDYPVFPDTQVQSNLKTAIDWFCTQSGHSGGRLVPIIFGSHDQTISRKLFTGDLRLSNESRGKWSDERFVVRARSEIDENTRTNLKRMLAFFEFSFLEGLTMQSRLFLGYFSTRQDLEDACALLESALPLLTGFGASRSRGYGQGQCRLDWEDIEEVTSDASCSNWKPQPCIYRYVLTPLVHIRNKVVNPGRSQMLASRTALTSEQLRGWFVRAYKQLFNDWPTPGEMASIEFSSFFPALGHSQNFIPAYPAPLTTVMRSGSGRIEDRFGIEAKQDDDDQQESFTREKLKSIPEGFFLTNENPPRLVKVERQKRMRNVTGDDFVPLKRDGLFVQEFVPQGTCYSGTVKVTGDHENFHRNARHIFANMRPVIAGAVFDGNLTAFASPLPMAQPSSSGGVFVLMEPADFSGDLDSLVVQGRLGTQRGYNTELGLPRRNRIIFQAGTIVRDSCGGRAVPWKSLGADQDPSSKPHADSAQTEPPDSGSLSRETSKLPKKQEHAPPWPTNLSRSQLGLLRRLASMDLKTVHSLTEQLMEKYARMSKDTTPPRRIPKSVYEHMLELLKDNQAEQFKEFMNRLIDLNMQALWRQNRDALAAEIRRMKEKAPLEDEEGIERGAHEA